MTDNKVLAECVPYNRNENASLLQLPAEVKPQTKHISLSRCIVGRVLIQNELLEQMDMLPYLGSLITEDGECTTEFHTRLNRGQAIGGSLQKI